MSYTVVLLPILSVLSIAHKHYLDPQQMWQTVNAKQQVFTDQFWPFKDQLSLLSEKELSSIISADVQEVNAFLKERGFDIQLEPFENNHPGNRAIASVVDILLKWKEKGTESTLFVDEKEYPAVLMPTNTHCKVKKYYDQEVAIIEAENKDTIYIMMAEDRPILDDFKLIEYLTAIDERNLTYTSNYKDILFPMVDINEKPDISWLLGLQFGGGFEIAQALQQTKFQMNEEGAAAQSAVAITVEFRCMLPHDKEPKHLVIDKPFYIWIKREGVDIPLFAAYVDQENWKKPAKLGGK